MHAARASLTGLLSGPCVALGMAPLPSSVQTCRNFCRKVLADWGLSHLEHDVSLVVSELVTNAVLHARTEMQLRLARLRGGVLVEVVDGSSVLPREQVASAGAASSALLSDDEDIAAILGESTTGRGLHLVNLLSEAWGAFPSPAGKTVWAVVGAPVSAAEIPGDAPASDEVPAGPGQAVRLAAIPLRLAVESDINLDTVVREFQLMSLGELAAGDGARGEAARLAARAGAILSRFVAGRRRSQQAMRASISSGDRLVDAELVLDWSAVEGLRQVNTLLEEVGRYCRQGDGLLSLAPSAEVEAFRRWYVDEVERQLGGAPAQPCPFTVSVPVEAAAPPRLAAGARAAVERFRQEVSAMAARKAERHLVEQAVELLGASQASVWTVGPRQGVIELGYALGISDEAREQWRSFSLSADFPASEAVRTGQVVVARTPLERDLLFPDFQPGRLVENLTLACVPVCLGGQARGCLAISFNRSRDFSPTDLELLRQLADAAAGALFT